ncbi:MAG: rhomboid family intramembrane serine protease [Oscillospiraceae bacterium]|nr:rhomboid family intramembrane serine protease [Oscillospiraceae bacterium]MBQ8979437.1 rhomboid family intramembrane serine protease [Oscillospiraceae bacterium]
MKLPKIKYNSPVVITFALISLGALILNRITGGVSNTLLFSVYKAPLRDVLTYPRFFLHVLGHADLSHYMNNFMIILLVGPMLEEKYGGRLLVGMITVTAFVTGLVFFIFFPHSALLGASGVVFMMILLSSFANAGKSEIPLTLILVTVLYLGTEIIDGLFTADNVSQLAHLVGGACGGIFGWLVANGSLKKR